MAVDIASLEPQILQILTAPDTDLTTISAKLVRRRLLEVEPSLSSAFVKENKVAVDAIIARVYAQVSGRVGGSEEGEEGYVEELVHPVQKRKRGNQGDHEAEVNEDEDAGDSGSSSTKTRKKMVRTSGRELSDAEIARQLSTKINSRARRSITTGRTRGGANGSSKKGRKTKSSALIETDEEEGGAPESKKTKVTKAGGTAKGSGFSKEYALSEPLAVVVGVDKLSRPQVVKHLWRYIKANELQNPQNKKEILCDGNLKAVFHVDKVDSFKMNKVLGQHLHESEG